MNCCICKKTINNPKKNQIHCIVCQQELKRISKKKKYKPREKQYLRTCRTCSNEFLSEYKVEEFCSVDCRKRSPTHNVNSTWLKQNILRKKNTKNTFNKFQKNIKNVPQDDTSTSGKICSI